LEKEPMYPQVWGDPWGPVFLFKNSSIPCRGRATELRISTYGNPTSWGSIKNKRTLVELPFQKPVGTCVPFSKFSNSAPWRSYRGENLHAEICFNKKSQQSTKIIKIRQWGSTGKGTLVRKGSNGPMMTTVPLGWKKNEHKFGRSWPCSVGLWHQCKTCKRSAQESMILWKMVPQILPNDFHTSV